MREIFVTNTNDFHFEDMFDGVEYQFPPNERVIVPVDAATHIFGFNMPDKTAVLSRLGWGFKYDPKSKTFTNDDEAPKRLAKFVFTRAIMVEERVESIPQLEAGVAPTGPTLAPDAPTTGRRMPKGAIEYLVQGDALDEPLI
jgi:hypothetical protein